MKIVHVVPHIDQEAAGPSYSIPRLCQSLAAIGNEVEISCLAARGRIEGVRLDLHRQWRVLQRFAVSSSLAQALWAKARSVDIVHNHSLWSMPNVATGWTVPGRGAALVTSPRGTLSAWALRRQRRLKKLIWPLQRRALERADLLHATSEAEYRDIRGQGFKAPVALVPNGIDLPALLPRDARSRPALRTALFLGRIHPVKGIDRLLHAWQAVEDKHPDWQLQIAGRGEPNFEREMRELATSLGTRRVTFTGPLYGPDKANAYDDAQLFVLPTHSENFGMVVAEALSHGCPAIVSRGAPWAGLQAEGCGWWIENSTDELAATLDGAMRLGPNDLADMGLRGRSWMEREFGWPSIASRMNLAYEWLLKGGTSPEWVLLD